MKKHTIALSMLLALCGNAVAQTAPEGDKWVGGFVEFYEPDFEKSGFPTYYDKAMDLGAEVGFRFKPQWAARLEYSRIDMDGVTSTQDATGNRVGADALYFLPDDLLYVFGGLKRVSIAGNSESMANVGLGKHWNVSDKFRIISEIASYHDFGEAYNDITIKLGFAYGFGETSSSAMSRDSDNDGVVDSKDQCANTPAGTAVDAKGCNIDLDGDGILNAMDQCPSTPKAAIVNNAGCNRDADGDGVLIPLDKCPKTAPQVDVGVKGCSLVLDTDEDGVLDAVDQCADTPLEDKVDATGCSVFTETEVAVNLVVGFGNNSSIITNPTDPQFQEFADFMNRFPKTDTVIEGHASAPGDASYNMMLSKKRAEAVRTLLINKYGIDAVRIKAVGFGETQLLDTANTREANKKNRRITAKVAASVRKKVMRN